MSPIFGSVYYSGIIVSFRSVLGKPVARMVSGASVRGSLAHKQLAHLIIQNTGREHVVVTHDCAFLMKVSHQLWLALISVGLGSALVAATSVAAGSENAA